MLRMRSVMGVSCALALAGCVSEPPRAVEEARDAPYVPRGDLALSTDPAVIALGPESRDALERSTVPMLVLPETYASGSLVMVGPTWTALSYEGDGITISLHATGHWHDVLDQGELLEVPTPTSRVRGAPAWETMNELIRSLAWNERRAGSEQEIAYALEIECARPEDDVRCTEGAFLATVAHQLVEAHLGAVIDPQQPGDPLQGGGR